MTDSEYIAWDDARLLRERARKKWLLSLGCLAGCMSCCCMVAWPIWPSAHSYAKKTAALNDVKELALSALMYANAFDDHLPHAAVWMDETLPYVANGMHPEIFRSPALSGANEFGFAFRRTLSAKQTPDIDEPEATAMIFDSIDTRWNANGGLDLLPRPGRYESSNVAAFVDGHVKAARDGASNSWR